MAQEFTLRHPQTGITKIGFSGFSWTTFFWSGFPALFRRDPATGLVVILLSIFSCGLAGLIWAFFYNDFYTENLRERGYVPVPATSMMAAAPVEADASRFLLPMDQWGRSEAPKEDKGKSELMFYALIAFIFFVVAPILVQLFKQGL
jgi:hypothetical protein